MKTTVAEIAPAIYRLSTFVPTVGPTGFTFNQFLIDADEPLLFHYGQRSLFPLIVEAVKTVIPLEKLRWTTCSHVEGDESGALNQWLAAAPNAQPAHGQLGCNIWLADMADRPPRALADDEVMDLGGKRVRWLDTPHVPHNWDAGLIYEETTGTLFSSDLFTQLGPADHGDWGAGKSSVLQMVKSQLSKGSGTLTVWFNGWAFEGYEDSKAVLIETLIEEIHRNRTLSARAIGLVKSLHRRLDYMKAAKKVGTAAFNYFSGIPTHEQLVELASAGRRFVDAPLESVSSTDVKTFVTSLGGLLKEPTTETLPTHMHRVLAELLTMTPQETASMILQNLAELESGIGQ